MKKGFLRCIAVIMVVLMTAVYMPMTDVSDLFSVEAAAATKTGSLGGNVSWKYDTGTKTITVSGSGNMKNFANGDDGQNWDSLVIGSLQYPNRHAEKIVINSGVTNIGNNAFRGLTAVKSVTIPASVTSIGASAFEGCTSLTSVNLPANLKTIGANAFKNTKFASVTMPDSVTSISSNSFAGVSGLKIVCNYNTDAYNCLVKNSIKFSFPSNKLFAEAKLDVANKQVLVDLKMVYNKADFNAGNFTLTYDSAVSPVSTEAVYKSENGVALATVYNSGKISFALMAETYVPYSTNLGVCVYDFGTIAFKVNGQDDTAAFEFKSDVLMMNNGKTTINGAQASAGLHSYSDVVTNEASCTQPGEKKTECSVCGKFTTAEIPVNPANHINGTKLIGASEANCGTKGYTGDTVCNDCEVVITKGSEIPVTDNHNYGSVVTDATCTTEGFTTYTCKVCQHSYTDNKTPVKGHDYASVVTESTCTTEGFTTYTCKVCQHSYTDNETPVKAHDYASVVTDATCTTEGFTTYTCKVCNHSYTDNKTPVKAHDYDAVVTDADCQTEGFITYTCKVCKHSYIGNETAVGDHKYDAVVTDPTCTVGGFTTYTCSVCGDSYKGDFTAQLGHDFDANGECTRCDETTTVAITFKDNTGITIDNDSKVIIINTTLNVSVLKANIASGNWIVVDDEGNEVEDTKAVVTGARIKAENADVIYTVVILGDINMDGKVNASDARTALRVASRVETIDGFPAIAANCDGKANITASDARLILRVGARIQTF